MSENKYTVTLKTAGMRSRYINESDEIKHSAMGHMWYELQQNNGKINSFGFQPLDDSNDDTDDLDLLFRGPGKVKDTDRASYLEHLPPITIQISQQQYETLTG